MRSDGVCLCPKFLHSASGFAESGYGRIAGGDVYFSHAEVIDRATGTRRLESYASLKASAETLIQKALERIEAPRVPILEFDLAEPVIMGIINVTPDSFSDGGVHGTTETAISQGRTLAAEGARILDVGGESTRPGSDPVDIETELSRVLPVIEGLRGEEVVISCDTRKSPVMSAALGSGASIINDVSSLNHDRKSRSVAAKAGAPVILMHSKGEPKVMQDAPSYEDVGLEVFDTLEADLRLCEEAGISRSRIIVDPGIGFGKTFDHNLELLHNLALFHGLGVPVMLGVSRKGFLGALTGVREAGRRAVGSVSAALIGLDAGVQFFRVHDVRQTVEAFAVWRGVARRRVG
ncbi:MAG: dihydropteroate synthase [Pseudomonadota bacterium]